MAGFMRLSPAPRVYVLLVLPLVLVNLLVDVTYAFLGPRKSVSVSCLPHSSWGHCKGGFL